MENTNLDQNIEQNKNIMMSLALCQINSSSINNLMGDFLAKKLDEKQVNSLKKMAKEIVDFWQLISLIDNTANQDQAKVENV